MAEQREAHIRNYSDLLLLYLIFVAVVCCNREPTFELQRTVDASWRHLCQFEAALFQEGDGDLHAVVSRTLQQQSEHLQAQNLMSLKSEAQRSNRDADALH